MKEILVRICGCYLGTYYETGKEATLQLTSVPEKGDYVLFPGIANPCRVVAPCFIPGADVPVIFAIVREEITPKTEG